MSEIDNNAAPGLLPADSVVISIDLESLGKPPTAPVLKIGISAFSPASDKPYKDFGARIGLTLSAAMKLGPINPDTLLWWMGQSPRAQFDTFECELGRFGDIESAAAGLASVMQDIRERHAPLPCWLLIKRPQYDLPLLENFLRAGGQDPAEVLGSFRAVIDLATEQLRFQWLAQQFLPPEQAKAFMHVERQPFATPHTSLGDAYYQGFCLRTWEQRLKALAATINTTESPSK